MITSAELSSAKQPVAVVATYPTSLFNIYLLSLPLRKTPAFQPEAASAEFSWSLPLHYKSEGKALLCKAFPVFMIFTYTSFDCVDHRPTTFNFCILSRFSSSEACTYRSNVIVTEACPNISDNDLTSNPTSTARVANVCPYGIITTNRKSPVYQGLSVIWQGFSSFSKPKNRATK